MIHRKKRTRPEIQEVKIAEENLNDFNGGKAVRCFSAAFEGQGLVRLGFHESRVFFLGEEGDRRIQKVKPENTVKKYAKQKRPRRNC